MRTKDGREEGKRTHTKEKRLRSHVNLLTVTSKGVIMGVKAYINSRRLGIEEKYAFMGD